MNSFIRHQDWEARLSCYLDYVSDKPFKWGEHDCALFAATCVEKQTGIDPLEAFRGAYDSRKTAAEALRTIGSGTLLKTQKAIYGQPISPHFAQRGDVVMMNATTVGICVGRFSYFVGRESGQEGLLTVPTSSCRYAFRIPFEAAE